MAAGYTMCAHSRNDAMFGCSLPNSIAFAQGRRSSRVLIRSFELINYASQARDASPVTNTTSTVEETYDGGPQESESICFETTIECHVALDVHAILQKWNSYHLFPYHGVPGNLAKGF